MSSSGKPPDRPSDDIKTDVYDPLQSKKSAPMQAISMKTPGQPRAQEEPTKTPAVPRPKLRAMSEVAHAKPPQNLGNLAPPYDPNAARMRSMQDYIIWGCVAVIIASAITLVVWFVAG